MHKLVQALENGCVIRYKAKEARYFEYVEGELLESDNLTHWKLCKFEKSDLIEAMSIIPSRFEVIELIV